jgi:serine/threonine-protein kinase
MIGQTVLGKYLVTRKLDHGGMCDIFLARQKDRGREVAVKVLQDALLKEAKAVEHFRREIFIMARFTHPHAVTYFDSGQAGKAGPVLVMEYLRGLDLNSVISREVRFTPERAGRMLVQLCEVLQAAHTAGVVHRDLKLGNIMVLNQGTLQESYKLMDFGLAKMTSLLYIPADELDSYVPPTTSGTPEYISPEQIRGNDGDVRSDLYSVGVMLFELLTGRLPFVHSDLDQLLDAHLDEQPPTFGSILQGNHIPPAIEQVVQQCLSKDPRERPQSAMELADLFGQALGRPVTLIRRPSARAGESSGTHRILSTTPPAAGGGADTNTPGPGGSSRGIETAADRHAVRRSFEASMPDAMAMVKLKGFIHDLGGEVLESVPGVIRVRLGGKPKNKPKGLLGWFGGSNELSFGKPMCVVAAPTDLEMLMERRNANEPNVLTISIIMRCRGGAITPEWRNNCQQIGRDLQAYLMGR